MQLHARYGLHYSTRIPRFGRDLAYDSDSADLLIAASAPEIYRLPQPHIPTSQHVGTTSPDVIVCRGIRRGRLAKALATKT